MHKDVLSEREPIGVGRRLLPAILALLMVLSTMAAGFWPGYKANIAHAVETGQTLTIIHTNDVHANVGVYPFVKGLKDKLRAENKEVITVSAGDDLAGTDFGLFSKGKDVAASMSLAQYDMAVIGNHEFMMKPSDYKSALDGAGYTTLACNAPETLKAQIPTIQPYEIVDFTEHKIAFIGIAYSYTEAPDLLSSVQAAKTAAEAEGATIFVGISHLGMNAGDTGNNSMYVADNCPWLTAIIDGHSHTVLPAGQVREFYSNCR